VEPDNFQVRSVLSLPIRDSDFKVIGVVQLMNKLNEKPFSDSDVNIVEVTLSRVFVIVMLNTYHCVRTMTSCYAIYRGEKLYRGRLVVNRELLRSRFRLHAIKT